MAEARGLTRNQFDRDYPAGADGTHTMWHEAEAAEKAQPALSVQIMTTEHFTLQSARGAATAESSTRSALFLTVLSAALVAVALAAHVTTPHHVLLLVLLALSVVFFLGLVPYLRVLDNGIEDYLYVKEMNRIRHFYLEVVPQIAPYFVLSHHDDAESIHRSMGMKGRRWEGLLTSAGAVGVVNGVVGGVLVGIALQVLFRPTRGIATASGAASAILVALGFLRHQTIRWREAEETAPPRFARLPTNRRHKKRKARAGTTPVRGEGGDS